MSYHLGFRRRVKRSTLVRANEECDWRLFAAFAHKLIDRARRLYRDEPGAPDFEVPVYAMDSALIDLSVALCPWANWTGTDAAVKLRLSLDLRGSLPAFVAVTGAELGDIVWLDDCRSRHELLRDGSRLHRLPPVAPDCAGRRVLRRQRSARRALLCFRLWQVGRSDVLRSDQSICFDGTATQCGWPDLMGRVGIYDREQSLPLAF